MQAQIELVLAGKLSSDAQLKEWIESFHRDDFLVIQNVLSPDRCELLKHDLDEIASKLHSEDYGSSEKKFVHRIFEQSQQNLDLFSLEPIVTFAEQLIGGANGPNYAIDDDIPNANTVHVIHNNSFTIPGKSDGLAKSQWHQDDTPHILSLDGKPLTNVRLQCSGLYG